MTATTPTREEIIQALKEADMETIWGYGIKKVLSNPTDENIERLIRTLKEQNVDDPRTMKAILGPGYETIINS